MTCVELLHARWNILGELHRGDRCATYLAEHASLGRKEVLRLLGPLAGAEAGQFRREARAVNRLRHPNIAAVLDCGQLADGRFVLATEHVDGASLAHLIGQATRFDVPRALHVLGQLAYALHHAHSRSIVHRALHAGSLALVGDDENVKVLDFGPKLALAPIAYRAPEATFDARSDLYAFGCIAFELLVGAPPFTGTPSQIEAGHREIEPEWPSVCVPGIPVELDAVVLRCLAKPPRDRFPSAAALFAALREVPGWPTPTTVARRRYVPFDRCPTSLVGRRPAGNVRGALRELAEAMIDLGADDRRLISGVALLRDHERELARLEAAQDALEHEAAAVRETTGDREASLRFALGDLGATVDDLHQALQARLAAAIADAERLRDLERAIARVIEDRLRALARLKQAYAALGQDVDEVVVRYGSEPKLAPYRARHDAARAKQLAVRKN